MNLRYRVELSQAERNELKALLGGGKHAVRKLKRAQILLAADAGASDEEIATSVGVGRLDRLPNQAPLCARQPGAGASRGAAPRGGAQALGQRGSPVGRHSLLKPAAGPRALDLGFA